MSYNSKLKSYKKSNPEVKSTTLRISEKDLEKVKKHAEKNNIAEGTVLRLLLEDAIEREFDNERKEQICSIENLQKENISMKKTIDKLNRNIGKICAKLEIKFDDNSDEFLLENGINELQNDNFENDSN